MEEITWGNTLSVVLTGLVVVFAALVILIFLVWLMGKIFIAIGNKKNKEQEQQKQDARRQAQQAMADQAKADQVKTEQAGTGQIEEGIPPEVVAAISAAVAVVMEESAPGAAYTIQRVQRAGVGRSAWGNAGLAAQLSPFDR
ncbi:MAG TPA: OadG family protein [Candidatus Egerieicola faecale]|uniref:OadG family protein n=1 Tax=Candidatus Egerieicola faecale TaxID=2840774 RepID=A0A9D1ISI1_9FIRM|nr:OadG family protein [Candidatus Egerieicola faecale]